MPVVMKKSITTAKMKKRMLEIVRGRGEDLGKLKGLDWEFVMGEKRYEGSLDLEQQIAYLELGLERISTSYREDEQGIGVEGTCFSDVEGLLAKRDKLMCEREVRELVISEAEEMA
jgi:hypothetical protein